ncbi:MAG: IS30 family transposase [Microthrixaceae bacterium]
MQRRWFKMPPEVRREVIRLAAQGLSYRQIIDRVDVSSGAVGLVLKPLGGVMPRERHDPGPRCLSIEERIEIRVGLEVGKSLRAIAAGLGRSPSTVCREVNNNGGRDDYRPVAAHRRAGEQARRPKVTKLAANPELARRVIDGLEHLWSPQQVSKVLAIAFSDDVSMQLSHETIYQSLFVQGRGELRRELTACLRTGRARRHPQGRLDRRGRIPDMVNISERPPEAEDRAVPGHWEGDLIKGRNNRSQIGTLVERTSRYVMLLHLPATATAVEIRDAMTAKVKELPEQLWKSITWDQGREMSQHAQFSIDTGIDVFFCDPHAPWQRGSNENTNGLLRQYFPKDTDLSVHTPEDLQAAADSLNNRPRQTLDGQTPTNKLAQIVATTA